MKKLVSEPAKGTADVDRKVDGELTKQLRALYSVMELNLLIAQGMATKDIGWLVTTAIHSLLEVPFVALALREAEDANWLVVGQRDNRPLDATSTQEIAALLEDGLADRVFSIAGSVLLADAAEMSGPLPEPLAKLGLRSVLVVPVRTIANKFGVMMVGSEVVENYTSEQRFLIGAPVNQVAVALENAKLLEKTRELSVTDELTGLYNRRHFYEVLESEIARTQRYGRSFSLVMLDIDWFKQYNDRFGHTNGDAVLKSLAQMLRSSLRKSDIAFRYGGDEFTIILPATDAGRASKIVDRIRSKWLQTPKAEYPTLETPLGFSAGIAEFPENAETADGLVFLADTALYRSKRGGGYKTTLVSELGTLAPDVLARETLDQVYALAATVDARDPYTSGHSNRVAEVSEMIGRAIGLSQEELATLEAAGLLHDIGKVGVPDAILTKPGKPTKDEWELIRKHPTEGARIVGYVKELARLVPLIRYHHEWYDGKGYPDGLIGEDIPLGARIISIADAYDTMTTKRTYRDVVSEEEALKELRRWSGTQFAPELVEALSRAMNEATRSG